ncbi:winged helix-turn-helix transcriptional regulator, partial [Candidatus Bathyarchaeota archaeon]|nr:winged helix-turn-helix transcriptional regulator [Candidatus Bathyarchaeota archaeon]
MKEASLSKPILGNYLDELQTEGMIKRDVNDRRIEYVLTDKGKGSEQLRRESLATAFEVTKGLIQDHPTAKGIF